MVRWALSEDAPFASGPFLSMGRQLCLWPVLVGKLRHLGNCFLVQDLGELVSGRGYLEPLIEDDPLPLKPYWVGPFDKASEVPFGLDVLFNAEVVTPFNKQIIHHIFVLLFLHDGRVMSHLLPLGLLSFEHHAILEEREKRNCG